MSPDEASAQASKKGNGSDAPCVMGRGAASSSLSEPPEIQLDASPAVGAASSPTADTTASSTQSVLVLVLVLVLLLVVIAGVGVVCVCAGVSDEEAGSR